MKTAYIDKNFRQKSLAIIDQANEIIEEFEAKGYDLTLRQLYYQFVARGLIPNTDRDYKNLGSVINDARLAGLIDWKSIVDRTRPKRGNSHWSDAADILESATASFRLDSRKDQKIYLEVWVEKDALVDVVERACVEIDVPFLSCRGFVSQSAMWQAAMRINNRGIPSIIIHLGDHDPSGIDMTRDIQDRLDIFECDATVERIALNLDQIEQYNPPPNPAKISDSRYDGYVAKYGEDSWELDALEPQVITQLIIDSAEKYTDKKKRDLIINRQEAYREQIQHIADNWDEITDTFL